MNVYVESNFVLELALRQAQSESCLALVDYAAKGRIILIVPAYSLAESPTRPSPGDGRSGRKLSEMSMTHSGNFRGQALFGARRTTWEPDEPANQQRK